MLLFWDREQGREGKTEQGEAAGRQLESPEDKATAAALPDLSSVP